VTQSKSLNLAGRRFRQTIDELYPTRIFPHPDALLHVFLQFIAQGGLIDGGRLQNDKGARLGQPVPILLPDTRGLKHGGMRDQRLLDLERRNPDAANLQHLITTAVKAVIAIGVARVGIAGISPFPAKRSPRFLALVPVTVRGAW